MAPFRTYDAMRAIHYLNSGDWVETMSALTEDENGEWKVIYYTELEH